MMRDSTYVVQSLFRFILCGEGKMENSAHVSSDLGAVVVFWRICFLECLFDVLRRSKYLSVDCVPPTCFYGSYGT